MNHEKDSVQEIEHQGHGYHHEQVQAQGFEVESRDLPKGYFTSRYFLGTFVAVFYSLSQNHDIV
jgi:hypothetical protein